MNLDKQESSGIFNTLALHEKIDKNRVKNIKGSNSYIVPLDEKKKVDKYTKLFTNDGYKVEYQHPELKDYGRVKQIPYTGLGTFCGEVRGYLANGVYIDVDMVNCHPVILLHEFKRLHLDTSVIGDYVNNRETFLKRENITKEEFLKYINKADVKPQGSVSKLHNQIYGSFLATILHENPDVKVKQNDYNSQGKFIGCYLQSIEFKLLTCLYNYCKSNGILIDVLMHDGFFVRITETINENIIKSKFLDKFNKLIIEKFSIDMQFKVKEHNTTLCDKIDTFNGLSSYEAMKKEFENSHCKIIAKSFFIKETDTEFITMTRSGLMTSYEHMKCSSLDKNGTTIQVSFINTWLKDPDMKVFQDVGCYPNEDLCPKNIFNIWQKFDMELITQWEPRDIKAILNHIHILCNHEEDIYQYFCKWIGQMIKYPETKSICPTLISSQGAGKGTLIQLFKKMLGTKKIFECTNPSRDVWGQFNSQMSNAFLVNLNELSKKDTYEAEGRIKGLITDKELVINNKGVAAYSVESYHRFIITTNNYEPVETSQDDRRNFIIRSSDEKCGNKEYFNTLYELLEDTNVVKSCYEYFKSLETNSFSKLEIPRTEHHKQLIEINTNPVELFLEYLTRTTPDTDLKDNALLLTTEQLYKSYLGFCESNGISTFGMTGTKLSARLGYLKVQGISTKRTESQRLRAFDMYLLRQHYSITGPIEKSQFEEEKE